jgi:hypothetical protein
MSTAKVGDLEIQIEELVREHIALIRRAASAAVDRGFGRGAHPRAKVGRRGSEKREAGRRRAPDEVAAVGERLYAAICAHPGAAMTALAAQVGVPPRQLNRPATQLRQAGRVRTVGQRGNTRYFPMSAKTATRS